MPLGFLRQSPLRRDEAPMRARTDARIFAVTPIDEVVAALAARTCVGRKLIGRETSRIGQFPRRLEQGEAQLFVRQLKLARVTQALEHGVRFDGQLIERDVVADIIEPLDELAPPSGLALSRPAMDEVESETREQRRGESHRGERFEDRWRGPGVRK